MSDYPLLTSSETILKGKWIVSGSRVVADDISLRIEFLITNVLVHIATDDDGWMVLYKDMKDNRYWELSYPDSGEHGGGAPMLRYLDGDEVNCRYGKG